MRAGGAKTWLVLAVLVLAGVAIALVLRPGAPSYASVSSLTPVYRTAQVRGSSTGGSGAVEFRVGGFTPGTTAYVALVGWSFDPTGGDHIADTIGIWTQKAISGGWAWSNDFPVEANGEVHGQFVVFYNDQQNNDDPYNILINFLVIGQ